MNNKREMDPRFPFHTSNMADKFTDELIYFAI